MIIQTSLANEVLKVFIKNKLEDNKIRQYNKMVFKDEQALFQIIANLP